MTYEIPPPLQHKNNIIFGLTFVQLLYAATSLIVITLILKLKINTYLKWSLITSITLIAILFMFFNAKDWLNNFYHFFKSRETDYEMNSMKKFMGIAKISNNLFYNEKDQKIAILEVQPINFNIKTEIEQSLKQQF